MEPWKDNESSMGPFFQSGAVTRDDGYETLYAPNICLSHYANTPMQHTAIFRGCKNDNFHLKIFDFFLIFAQNIDCGYTLEPPQ